ncbi:MAG: hypothetical protein EBY51_00845 [Actinobacteria bacterium]|nr:hypothetical protein [Actinomycetota bacterium]
MKGRRQSGRSFLKDDLFLVDFDQFYMWRSLTSGWHPHDRYCFVQPVPPEESIIFKPLTEEPLVGIMRFPNDYLLSQGIESGDMVTFKPDSDDVRDSPALDVAVAIYNAGAHVRVHDPKGLPNAERVYPHMDYRSNLDDAATGSDLLILGTEWREYRDLDPASLIDKVRNAVIIDGRNVLDPHLWRSAGWTYRALGRPTA